MVIVVGVIITILLIGVLIFSASSKVATTPDDLTSTPGTPINTDSSQVKKPATPLVTTSASVVSSDTTAALTGTVIPNGTFTSYWYEYDVSSDIGNKVQSPSQTVGSGFASIPAPSYITGLVKNTTYYFRLVAFNRYGRTAGTQYSFRTTEGNPPPVGSIPTVKTLAGSGISRTTADVVGEVTPNMASTQYWFEFGQTTYLGNITSLESIGNGTVKVSASKSLSNLSPSTVYYYRINAQNQFGTVNGVILNFKTLGPPGAVAPVVTTRSATNLSSSTAIFRGTVNPNGAETTYWFEYSTDSLLGSALLRSTERKSVGTGSNTTSVETNVLGLSSKTNYYFRLVAQNNFGTFRGERMTFKTR